MEFLNRNQSIVWIDMITYAAHGRWRLWGPCQKLTTFSQSSSMATMRISSLSSMMMLCPLANHTLLALFGAEVNSFLSCPQNDEWQYHWFRILNTNKIGKVYLLIKIYSKKLFHLRNILGRYISNSRAGSTNITFCVPSFPSKVISMYIHV